MLSQTAISLHHMCLTHRMAGRSGVCREHSQERGKSEEEKFTTWNPEWAAAGARSYPVMFRLQHLLMLHQQGAHHAFTLIKMHPVTHVNLFWDINTYAGKQMSQVLTQKEPGTPHKMVVSCVLLGPSPCIGCGADTLIMWLERMENSCASTVVAFRLSWFIQLPREDAFNLLSIESSVRKKKNMLDNFFATIVAQNITDDGAINF